MKGGDAQIVRGAALIYTPLTLLFSFALLTQGAGWGAGWIAGLAAGAAFVLHALIFGADASLRTFPPWLARTGLALGVVGAAGAVMAPGTALSGAALQGGLYLAVACACSLIVVVLFGRAAPVSDADWS